MDEGSDPPCGHAPAEDEQDDDETPQERSRRRFLSAVTVGVGALVAAVAAVPVVSTLLLPLFRRRGEVWVPIGRAESFAIGHTVKVTYAEPGSVPWSGASSKSAAWLRRESEDEFIVLSGACTHTGCPVQWRQSAELFLCPCHGGAFYPSGAVAAGPPPRPLPLVPVRIRRGTLEVQPQPITARETT
ncbi:MAG: Rieske 2Fe-2S domain-containing protein [Myxococcota bacterium]|nr:Rieske 2Fe-2S domain-containing protein [Myxococcota bacterium]